MRPWRQPDETRALYEAPSPLAPHDRAITWGIFGLALLARAAYLKQLRDSPLWDDLPVDLSYYRDWATRIAGGELIGSEVFEQSPLYAYFLAAIFKIFGNGNLLVPRLIQIAIGAATCALVYKIGRRIFGPGAGLAAGMMGALYGPFLFYDGMLMKEVFAVFFMTAMLHQLVEANGAQRGLLGTAGLCLALGALVRDNMILLAPAVCLWLALDPWIGGPLMTKGRLREEAARIGSFAFGVLLVVIPVGVRNWNVSGELVPLTAGGGEVFYIGNNPGADGRYSPPPFVRARSAVEHADFRAEAARRLGIPPEVITRKRSSDYWLSQGLAWMRGNPGAFLALLGRKLLIFWNHYELPDNQSYEHHRRLLPILRLPLLTFGWLAPMAAAGLVITLHRWRDLMILYLAGGGYVATVMLFFNFGRFRMPLIPVLLLFAGCALLELPRAVVRRRWLQASAAVTAACFMLAIGGLDLEDDPLHLGQGHAQLAELLRTAERLEEALAESDASVRTLEAFFVSLGGQLGPGGHGVPPPGSAGRPDLGASFYDVIGEAYVTRARILRALDRSQEAVEWERRGAAAGFQRSGSPSPTRTGPPSGRAAAPVPVQEMDRFALLRLAEKEMDAGRFGPAADAFGRALAMMGADAEPLERYRISLQYAEALHRSGRPHEGLAAVEKALEEAPPDLPAADHAAAHYGRSLIYRGLGHPERMRFHMRECIRLDPTHPRAEWMRSMIADQPGVVTQP